MSSSGRIINLANPTSDQDAATRIYVDTSIPIGGIIMWSGAGVTLPSNWKLCDGTTYNGVTTPDLRSRFIMGASSVGVSRLENKSVGNGDVSKVGSNIRGDQVNEYSGASVSISADGKTVAVGAYGYQNSTGVTRVYRYNETIGEWSQLGSNIVGQQGSIELSGYSLSLSADGTILAVGAYGYGQYRGIVRVYKYQPSILEWGTPHTFPAGSSNDYLGYSVSLSADGTTVAMGAFSYNSAIGYARVYRYNDNLRDWLKLSQDISVGTAGDKSGSSVSLSADGSTIAVGSPYASTSKGITRIYRFTGGAGYNGTWPQLGPDILGENNYEQSGSSVSLSADGTTVAVGAYTANQSRGVTRIYRFTGGAGYIGTWPQLGSNILGYGQSGYSVSLSADGTTVAIGARTAGGTGLTCLYKYSGTTWSQLGSNIFGVEYDELFGNSVSLSADGTTVAIGAFTHNGGKGVTRVYSLDTLLNPNIYGLAFIMRIS